MSVQSPTRHRSARRLVIMVVGLVVLALVVFVAIPRFADYHEVWRSLRSVSGKWLIAIAAADIVNLATYAPNWMVCLPGLGWLRSMELTMAGTAVANVAPLGGAVSMSMQYGMMREWGFERRAASRAMVLTGVWNNFVNLGMPVVAVGLLTLRGGRNAALMAAARIGLPLLLVGIGLFMMVLRSERGARLVGGWWDAVATTIRRVLRRPPVAGAGDALARFRVESIELLRRRWPALTVATVGGVLTVFVVFVTCVRAVGIHGAQITFTEAFAAWSATRLLSAIPITPGGLGIVDVGLAGALTAFGADKPAAVGAVLLYRVLTWLPPVLLGAVAAITWRRHGHRRLTTR
jgi:putative heme transporter